jgi:low affinity Fe/Cu permease
LEEREHHREEAQMKINFAEVARRTSDALGSPVAFMSACTVVAAWLLLGPVFNYSDTWQLLINTATTIVTFLMVFLVQHTQNRDTMALQLKLDELLRATKDARNKLIDLEHLSDDELQQLRKQFEELARKTG